MNKKILSVIVILVAVFFSFSVDALAAKKTITVHYYGETRKPTYDYTYNYVGFDFNVMGTQSISNSSAESTIKNSVIFIAHNHGSPGRQDLSNGKGISGTNGDSNYKAISSMSTAGNKPVYLAIYYGCNTGDSSSAYGNILTYSINKFAKSAIAWTISTAVADVNYWNRFLFEKAKNLDSTIAQAITYADTKLAASSGVHNASGMKNQRVTAGSFNFKFRDMAALL